MAILDRRLMLIAAGATLASGPALAGMGQPSPWQMGFQEAGEPDHGADHRVP